MTWPPEWTDDCQGKKDYDGSIVRLSTRYWPRGGGFAVFDTAEPEKGFRTNALPHMKPSAHASIVLDTEDSDECTLAEKDFEADTEEEVKAAVEQWAAIQYECIAEVLKKMFLGARNQA
jgi:hypothetical protein